MLCHRYYAEIYVAIFTNQIDYEYYGSNQYVSIEVIALDHFSEPTQTESE